MLIVTGLLLFGAVTTAPAAAQTLRMAAIAPEGSSWARVIKSAAQEINTKTGGRVHMKWYLGGIAGSESESLVRTLRGQLDGLAGPGFCDALAPSWRALSGVGLFRNRAEALFIMQQLHDRLAAEFEESGFELLGWGAFGHDIVFSRVPFHSFAELKRVRLWAWGDIPMARAQYQRMGLNVMLESVDAAANLYDQHQVDGFIAAPTAALAFQWSGRTRYFANLPLDQIEGCVVITKSAFDKLTTQQQAIVRAAMAEFSKSFEQVNQQSEQALLRPGGLLQHQGLTEIHLSSTFLKQFQADALDVRNTLNPHVVDTSLIREIYRLLTGFRQAEHAH